RFLAVLWLLRRLHPEFINHPDMVTATLMCSGVTTGIVLIEHRTTRSSPITVPVDSATRLIVDRPCLITAAARRLLYLGKPPPARILILLSPRLKTILLPLCASNRVLTPLKRPPNSIFSQNNVYF